MSIAGKLVIALLVAIVMTVVAIASLGDGTPAAPLLGALFLLATLAAVLLTHRPLTAVSDQSTQAVRQPSHRARSRASLSGSAAGSGPRREGRVKWFNAAKGFGFITLDTGEEIFVHFRSIRGEGRRSLEDGQRVSFVVADTDKGPQAEDVDSLADA